MPPALGAPTQTKYIPSPNLMTPSGYLDQMVYSAAGEPVPAAAPVATENSAGQVPVQTAPAPVPSEVYGGPTTEAVGTVSGDPYAIQTSYPAANAAAPGGPYTPTVDQYTPPVYDQPVASPNDPYGAYGSAQLMPSRGRRVTPPLDDPAMMRTAFRGDTQPLVFDLPGTGDPRGAVPSERYGGAAPAGARTPSPNNYVEVFRNNPMGQPGYEVRPTGYQQGRDQTAFAQEPTSDPYARYQAGASDIRTLPAQQPSAQPNVLQQAGDWLMEPVYGSDVTDAAGRAANWLMEPIPGTEGLGDNVLNAAGNILPGLATFLTPGMDPVFGNRVREAQDAVGQVESSEAGRLSKDAHQKIVDPFVEKGLGSIFNGFKRSATLANRGLGNATEPTGLQSAGVRDAAWTSGTRDYLEDRGVRTSAPATAVDPYANTTSGTSSGAQTTPPVVNDGDVSRNRAAKLLTPDLQFVTSERTSDAFGGGTGSYSLRVIHGEPGAPVATDAIVTPDSMAAAQQAGMAPWMLNDDEFAALVDAGLVTEDAKAQVVGKPLLIPGDWAEALGTSGDTLTDVQAVDPYTAPATDTSSDSGSGWVDYGNGGGGGGYRRRSYSSGGGGGGYSRSYGGGGYSSGGGDWGGGGFDMSWLPEGFGGEDGFMSGSFDSPIFARYFDVLSRHMGEERAMSLLQGMRGMKRGFKRSKRSRYRSMPNGRTLTTKGPRQSSVNEGLNVPSNESVRKDVGKQIKKATKDKEA